MSEKEKTVEVTLPIAMTDYIRTRKWFKLYNDLEDFIIDAIRHRMEDLKKVGEK